MYRYVRSGYGSKQADFDIVNEHGGRVASTPYEDKARVIVGALNAPMPFTAPSQSNWRDFHTYTAEAKALHAAKYGEYNDFPPNWRRLTEKQFAQSHWFMFSPVLVEFRQMLNHVTTRERNPLRDQAAVSAQLFYMHDNKGYAMVSDYVGGYVRFYAFGCKGIHQNNTTCEQCGFAAAYDSSG